MRVLLNGLNQRPGGGLVVLEAIARGMLNAIDSLKIEAASFHSDSCETLRQIDSERMSVHQPAKSLGSFENFLLSRHINKIVKKTSSDLVIGLNHFVPGCSVPQIIYHVNLSRFTRQSGPLGVEELLHRVRDWSSKAALQHASANVFESRYVLGAAQQRYPVKINRPEVIYIGVDDRSLVGKDLKNRGTIQPIIVVVTSPQPHKRNELLVPILSELKKRVPLIDWKILIFGGLGPEVWKELKAEAQKHGVLEQMEFLGYRSREVVNAALDSATCLLSTSAVESFCMVALEGMARGCPVIVSQDAAMPESVGENGIVMSVTDPTSVSGVIERLYSDVIFGEEYSRKGIQHAGTMTWSKSGQQFSDVALSLTR